MRRNPKIHQNQFLIEIGFLIISAVLFVAVYNAHGANVNWIQDYFGGLVSSIFFAVLGIIFIGISIYSLNKK